MVAWRIVLYYFFISFCFWSLSHAQDTLKIRPARYIPVAIGSKIVYGGTLYVLNKIWYSQSAQTTFHWFDDSHEWKQMDKLGHAYTCYHVGRSAYHTLKWSGFKDKQAVIWGGLTGFLMMAPIEYLDGNSAAYGGSATDLLANMGGSVLFISQQLFFEKQYVTMKFSYHHSPYATIRPNVLGSNFQERLIKDYNGQTLWLSFFPFAESKTYDFLAISIGMSGDNMLYGEESDQLLAGKGKHYRQLFVSGDIRLAKLPLIKNSKLYKWVDNFDIIKFPFPAVGIYRGNIHFHPIYF